MASAIIGLAAVAALAALTAELRGAAQARRALEAEALAQHRIAVLELLRPEDLPMLPDSVADGRFEPPFDDYTWHTSAERAREEPTLVDATVRIGWPGGEHVLSARIYRRRPSGISP